MIPFPYVNPRIVSELSSYPKGLIPYATAMTDLMLYVTSQCHLCEQAKALIDQTLGIPTTEVEIIDDPGLFERYGVRIPVLRHQPSGAELDWPFAATELERFIDSLPAPQPSRGTLS